MRDSDLTPGSAVGTLLGLPDRRCVAKGFQGSLARGGCPGTRALSDRHRRLRREQHEDRASPGLWSLRGAKLVKKAIPVLVAPPLRSKTDR